MFLDIPIIIHLLSQKRCMLLRHSLVPKMVKNLPATQETQIQSLGQEDPLEKEMATHSSILGDSHEQRSLVGYNLWCRRVKHD